MGAGRVIEGLEGGRGGMPGGKMDGKMDRKMDERTKRKCLTSKKYLNGSQRPLGRR
jgi:hypothetical protein